MMREKLSEKELKEALQRHNFCGSLRSIGHDGVSPVKKTVLRSSGEDWTDEFGNVWMRVDANGQALMEDKA